MLTAELSGYGASQTDSTKWVMLDPVRTIIATFSGVNVRTAVDAAGFTVTPESSGTTVTTPTGTVTGSWPQEFVDFQERTGQSSYWYSSGTGDADKVPLPLSIGYTSAYGETPVAGSSLTRSGAVESASPQTSSGTDQSQGTTGESTSSSGVSGSGSGAGASATPSAVPAAAAASASPSSSGDADLSRHSRAETPRRIGLGAGALGASLVLPIGAGCLIRRGLGLAPGHPPLLGR